MGTHPIRAIARPARPAVRAHVRAPHALRGAVELLAMDPTPGHKGDAWLRKYDVENMDVAREAAES